VRYISRAYPIAWAVPLANWARITPYLVSHRRYRHALLEQMIMVFLNGDEALDSVLAHFQQHDETTVQAALFQLLADGWVISPDLAVVATGWRHTVSPLAGWACELMSRHALPLLRATGVALLAHVSNARAASMC